MEGKIKPGWRIPNPRGTANHATVAPTMRATVGENAKFATNEDTRLNSAGREALRLTTYNLKEQIKLLQKAKRRRIGEQAKEQLLIQMQIPEEKARRKKVTQRMILQ